MLVISRKQEEEILIGKEQEILDGTAIKVKVIRLGTGGGSVRIGIDAPEGTRIVRGELVAEGRFHCNCSPTAGEAASNRVGNGISSSTK